MTLSASSWRFSRGVLRRLWTWTIPAAVLALPLFAAFAPVSPGLATGRSHHTVTLLQDGRVLVTGGWDGVSVLSSAEVHQLAGQSGTSLSMGTARSFHTATVLPSGKVLLAGGTTDSTPLDTAEVFDPSNNSFTATASPMSEKRYGHSATMLVDGRVLLAGGNNGNPTDTIEIYDPATNAFTLHTTKLSVPRSTNAASLLPDGKVLISGGLDSGVLDTADVFDPTTGGLSTFTMNAARSAHSSTLLANGKVLLAGGPGNTAELFNPANSSFTPVSGTMTIARDRHRATLLPSGAVLITGGMSGGSPSGTSEYYLPDSGETGQFAPASAMQPRHSHGAVLLPSGKILVVGGEATSGQLTGMELFDAVAAFGYALPPMPFARARHTSTLLPDGRVLLLGGPSVSHKTIFTPPSTWSGGSVMSVARHSHTATLLPSGKVLVTGGLNGSESPLATAEIYDPAIGFFRPTGSMTKPRAGHRATLLTSGRVLITGGAYPEDSSAEVYDPVRGGFDPAGPMAFPRQHHTSTLLRDGTVLISGGNFFDGPHERFDPATGTFHFSGSPVSGRTFHTATLLPSGRVLIRGGEQAAPGPPPSLIYDPSTETSTAVTPPCGISRHTSTAMPGGFVASVNPSGCGIELWEPMTRVFSLHLFGTTALLDRAATLLTDGRVLVTGGYDLNQPNSPPSTTAHLVETTSADPSRRPTISAAPAQICQPASVSLSGTRFAGDSEGSTGSWQSSAANAPILRLQAVEGDMAHHLPPQAWTPLAFTSAPVNDLPVGWHRMSIVSNGIPSLERLVVVGRTSTPATLGNYSSATVTNGDTITVMPTAAPSTTDASKWIRATATGGFQGGLSVDPVTGAVTIAYAMPVGTYPVTVTMQTACNGTVTRTFNLTVARVAPPVITAEVRGLSGMRVTWPPVPGAAYYELYRGTSTGGMTFVGVMGDDGYTAESGHGSNITWLFRARSVDNTSESVSEWSNYDLATTVAFEDDPLTPGTPVKAAHLQQLRTAVNAVHLSAGLGGVTFTGPASGIVRSQHFSELRAALDNARAAIGLPALAYSTSIAPGQPIRASAVVELRNGVK